MTKETKVVNVKVAFIRPKYQNLKEWIEDPENVYIGRAGIVFIDNKRFPSVASPFCNPFKVGKDSREDVCEKFREYMEERLKKEPSLKEELLALRGKTLGCWCKPDRCHGDVLVELIEKYS